MIGGENSSSFVNAMLNSKSESPLSAIPSEEIDIDRVSNIKEFRKPERLTCQLICTNILLNPVRCSKCSTHFCKSCYDKWLQKNKTCPKCRQESTEEKPETILKEELEDLLIYCRNKELGCSNPIKYEFLLKHEASECEFQKIKCKWCEFEGKKFELALHLDNCDNKKMTCKGCLLEIVSKDYITHTIPCMDNTITQLKENATKENTLHFTQNVYQKSDKINLIGKQIAVMTANIPNQSSCILLKPRLKKNTRFSWQVKIVGLKEWIGIGVSDFTTIVNKGCTLSDSEIELRKNGCVMISSNGIAWNHFESSENYTEFELFTSNDIVTVMFDSARKKCTFIVNSRMKILKLPATVTEWYPVIILGTTGDSVEIVSSSFD